MIINKLKLISQHQWFDIIETVEAIQVIVRLKLYSGPMSMTNPHLKICVTDKALKVNYSAI